MLAGLKNIMRIFSYFGKYKKTVALVVVFTVFSVVGGVYLPYMMADIINNGIAAGDVGYLFQKGVVMLIVTVVTFIFGILGSRAGGVAAAGLGHNLRIAMMEKLCEFSAADIDAVTKASYINRMTTDITSIQDMTGIVIGSLLSAPLNIVCILLISAGMDKKLSLILLLSVPVFAVLTFLIVRSAGPYFKKYAFDRDRVNRIVLEDLMNIRLVKAFVREAYMSKHYQEASGEVKRSGLTAEQISNINTPVQQLLVNGCVILILWYGGRRIIAGSLQVGDLFSFITYMSLIMVQVLLIGMFVVPVAVCNVSLERVLEVLEMKTTLPESSADTKLRPLDGTVEFDHVCFDYSSDTAEKDMLLQNITLSIKDGEKIGIIGPTGSGKSTLINLIPRLHDIRKGTLKVGGIDIRELSFKNLRETVSVSPQKSLLFSGTLRENLLSAKKNASEEELARALKEACIDDFSASDEKGLDCIIEEGGNNVSGGQRQRLCLARALLKDSRILILDDCTSAFDKTMEAEVIDHIAADYADRTRIIISNKISTMKKMDRIVVIDKGKIAGIGTHEELLEGNAIYRDLCASQRDVSDGDEGVMKNA